MNTLSGQIVDIHKRSIYPGTVTWENGRITTMEPHATAPDVFILPGFIDAHVHIESSLMVPSEFACMAVRHGTVATVSDPHEIANVLGVAGVEFMIENGKQVPLKIYFGAPSCVPATGFETAGASVDEAEVLGLLRRPDIRYLSEMMNWPGVLARSEDVMKKIAHARVVNKPIDGHAPGLSGQDAVRYLEAGITTDHECYTLDEADWKARHGARIIIREGSAARNFDALIPMIGRFPDQIMFCTDDCHPDYLSEGHINRLVTRALAAGYDLFDVLRAACLLPIEHYSLDVGTLRPGEAADFITVRNLNSFEVTRTVIDGKTVFENGETRFGGVAVTPVNRFVCNKMTAESIAVPVAGSHLRVIEALDGELITRMRIAPATIMGGHAVQNTSDDILKIVSVNRYAEARPAVAFIQGFGLKNGAIASSVAHDSHNILAVGSDDTLIERALNLVIEHRGGLAAVSPESSSILPLPVAGIMSDADAFTVTREYIELDLMAKAMGSPLRAPFMTLSFMGLLVIPSLKLSDLGLFDGASFQFIDLWIDAS